jgi:7,8-dihydropterin-6-yl-methyl-4-(beta-D-ribofuranosyl)aminobenzene 5'-phosphate synthase
MRERVKWRNRILIAVIRAIVVCLAVLGPATNAADGSGLSISVVYNNLTSDTRLQTEWGFAAVIEGPARTLLFDTGSNGRVLLSNMERMGIDPREIDGVFLTHNHSDHTGGLGHLLRRHPDVGVYMPASFPIDAQKSAENAGAQVTLISEPATLFEGVYSTGPLWSDPVEQSLILDTPEGLMIMTGCAHPGIVNIVEAAVMQRGKPVRLVAGGFHLHRQSEARIKATIDQLKALGVAQVAPSHCTGDRAIAMFRDAWGKDFLDSGCGAVIDLAP